jgi:hypothetical protein
MDTCSTRCISSYQGSYANELAAGGHEIVAVHTTETAMLRWNVLNTACLERSTSGKSPPHLIIDEAGDHNQESIINAGLVMQGKGLLRLWIVSATMPAGLRAALIRYPHSSLNLGGLAFGRRVLTVECERAEWFNVARSIERHMRCAGQSTLLFVTPPAECTQFEEEDLASSSDDAEGSREHCALNRKVIAVHGSSSQKVTDSDLTASLEDN